MASIRSPVCVLLAHVDHGKTTLLDQIRGSAIAAKEAGGITQAIGASIIPLSTIKKVCGDMLKKLQMQFTIPGILMIDSPGHAAFTNLRKRGGNLADIAILVVDINEGFMPQTVESIEILKTYKTPFVIAANKIDLLPGWQSKSKSMLDNASKQNESTQKKFETRIYEVVGKLHEVAKINAERFDRVEDYTKQVAIVPVSAKTGEGVPELLMVLTGLAQKYLEKTLKFDVTGPAKGTVLEVKEEKGIGTSLDVIIYDGTLKVNDLIVIGGIDQPIVTKVRALFEPMPLAEMRDKKAKFNSVKQVVAATGVKIAAPDLKEAVAGMPMMVCSREELDKVKEEIQAEVEEVLVQTDEEGIVVKADTLGSLEAVTGFLKQKNILVKKASVGNITKKDIMDAEVNSREDPLKSAVLGFNVVDASNLCNDHVTVICDNVIYKLIERFEKWQEDEKKRQQLIKLGRATFPCKVKLMAHYVFRQSNPAIVGTDVLAGKLRIGLELMKADGKPITEVKEIQQEKDNVDEVESGKQVAVAYTKVTVGRQINEGDILYSYIPEKEFRKLKDFKEHLTKEQKELLKEIAEIMRKDNTVWGV